MVNQTEEFLMCLSWHGSLAVKEIPEQEAKIFKLRRCERINRWGIKERSAFVIVCHCVPDIRTFVQHMQLQSRLLIYVTEARIVQGVDVVLQLAAKS